MKKFLVILTVILSLSSNIKGRKVPNDLSWLFSMEESDSVGSEETDDDNEIVEHKKAKVCDTEECRMIANAFRETMNKSVDPCNDFYEYACGGWAATQPIPKYEVSWSRFLHFQTTVENRIKELMEEELQREDILPVRQAKKWYRSCMDTEGREARGLKPIESLIMQNGGWPMIMDAEEWQDDGLSWQEIDDEYARLTGDSTFWRIEPVSIKDQDPDKGIVFFPPTLPLDEEIPLKSRNYTGDDFKSYRRLMKNIAELFIDHTRADVSKQQLEKDVDDVIRFERMLYMASEPQNPFDMLQERMYDLDDEADLDTFLEWWSNHTKSVEDPQAKIDWKAVLERMFDSANVKLEGEYVIGIASNRYLIMLQKILKAADKRTIVNYIHWRFVSQNLRYTIDEAKDMLFEIVKEEYGAQERPPRWRECVKEMEMKDAAALLFVAKYIKESSHKAVLKLMKNIQKELKNQIDTSNWISAEGKEKAKEKVDKMETMVGFPDWYKNETAVMNHYKGLTIGNEYLDNVLSFMRYQKKLAIRAFGGYKKNEEWMMDVLTVNAAYAMGINIMIVPAVDFQPPLFGDQVPNYVNYGTAGVVIGHEMGHGLDYAGIEAESLDRGSIEKTYYQRAKCFIDQFDEYYGGQTVAPFPGRLRKIVETRGMRTAGENVADTTGIQSVLSAYKKMQKNRRPHGELKLPGFEDYTDEQMFFISFAGLWCEVATPEYHQREEVLNNSHSPGKYRVIGSVSNTLDFAEVFNCPKGSPMNPDDKCSVWMKPGAAPKAGHSKHSRRHHWSKHRNW